MIANQPMKEMTHSDTGVRPGSGKLVGHGALQRARRSLLEVALIDVLSFMPFNFKSFDDLCSRLRCSIAQLFNADDIYLNISIRYRP